MGRSRLLSASKEPGSLQTSFHSVLILVRTSGAQDRVIMVLGLCHMLLTDPVCFYSMYGNHKPHAPATRYGTTWLLPWGLCSPPAQLTTLLNFGFEIKKENYIIVTEKY